jgi:hypothetical protein
MLDEVSEERTFQLVLAVFVLVLPGVAGGLLQNAVVGIVLFVVLVLLALGLGRRLAGWLAIGAQASSPADADPVGHIAEPVGRTGILAGPGSRTNVRRAQFGPRLDTSIRNDGGDVDAEEATFR